MNCLSVRDACCFSNVFPVSYCQCTQTVSSSVPLTGGDEVAFRPADQCTRWMGQCRGTM
ncbi:hypothetical protein PAMP_013829 [Pampus punctatissimus]